jgi:hypothetical protein
MAQVARVTWNDLSTGAKDTLAWARAVEVDATDVGTRGLLIGMLRSGEDPANALVRHFALDQDALFAALQREDMDKRLEPDAPERAVLRDMPSLTMHASACVDAAADLQREHGLASLDVACLLASLLQTRGATAANALRALLPEGILEPIAQATLEWLRGNDLTYPQTLQRHFPQAPRPATKGAATQAPRPHTSELWPFLAVMRRHAADDSPARFRATGLGFVDRDGTLITTARSAAVADALAHLPGDDSEHEFRTLVEGDALVSLALTPRPPAMPDGFITPARAGQTCRVATIDDQFLDIRLLDGVVAEGDETEERFTVALNVALSEDRTATGSPVVNADGDIIGIVGPTGTNRSVDAYGSAAIARVLPTAEPTPAPPPDEPAPPPPPAIGTLAGAGNDSVGKVDQLGFTTYVQAFADLITSPHTQPPLTIGIFGSWGMGKSFLLEHIEREINARQPPEKEVVPRVHVVRFNAWEYSATEVVWPGLARKIVSHLDRLDTWPWYKRLGTRVRWNVARQWHQLRTQLIAGALVVGTAIAVALNHGEDGIAAAIAAVTTALGVGGLLKAAKDPVANWVTALFAESDYGRQLGVMEDIKHDLESLEERLHRTDADGNDIVTGRILVLIDDLDRCEPAKAVEVLQAVNLLLNFRSFVVCLGIDARIITGAVEKHYEGLLGRAGASGYEYLDKIVQIPFRIPEPGRADILTFIAGQLGDPTKPEPKPEPEHEPPGDAGPTTTTETRDEAPPDPPAETPADDAPSGSEAADSLDRDRILAAEQGLAEPEPPPPPPADIAFTYAELEAFERFADHLRPNPRHLKRLVNVYRLVRSLAIARDERLVAQRPAATIRWLVMWSQWPFASLAMVDRYDALVDEHGDKLAERVAVEDPLLHLLDAVKPGLDAEWCARLDDDHDDLRKLLTVPGCGLSWDEIRRIRRFTVNFNPAVEEQLRQPPAATGADTA